MIFSLFTWISISIKASKAFLGYLSVQLLEQKVDFLGLSTFKDKLVTILKLDFLWTLCQLKTYLSMTGWLRQYISHYAVIMKSLQDWKMNLLKPALKARNLWKAYSVRTCLNQSTEAEIAAFHTLQDLLSWLSFLTHFDPDKPLYIDLDMLKEFEFDAMIYHMKGDVLTEYSAKSAVQSILFLSQLLKDTETHYWPTKLEVTEMIWVVRKTRHMIQSSKMSTIVFTNHNTFIKIIK